MLAERLQPQLRNAATATVGSLQGLPTLAECSADRLEVVVNDVAADLASQRGALQI
jgi:hypothetical protein